MKETIVNAVRCLHHSIRSRQKRTRARMFYALSKPDRSKILLLFFGWGAYYVLESQNDDDG